MEISKNKFPKVNTELKTKKVAILQSNYIPWKGYFDLIDKVDEFILYDDVQYTRRDWRNRNKIKTSSGIKWLTIPVDVKGKYYQKIKDTKVASRLWATEHWKTISYNYAKAPYFQTYRNIFEDLYLSLHEDNLSIINYTFIEIIKKILNIKTKISFSSDYQLEEGKNERLISLCKQAKATEYISGPAAKCYINTSLFSQEGISVSWMNYDNYPEYKQLYPPFEHGVSILDLIFCAGPQAVYYMKKGTDLIINTL